MKRVTVIGGVTMDLIYTVSEFPSIGRMVAAQGYTFTPGGKALNIATCIHRMHAKAELISSVGKDECSKSINRTLRKEQLSKANLIFQESFPTDVISIIVPPHGRAGYIGTHTANYALTEADIDARRSLIESSDALIVTLEIPHQVAKHALKIAKKAHVPTFLTPSLPNKLSEKVLRLADYLILDEWQSEIISGMNRKYSEENILQYFAEKYDNIVLITKDKEGCVFIKGGKIEKYSGISYKHVDMTGFTSAFVAVLAVSLMNGEASSEAVRKAIAAGTLAAGRLGSRESMPTEKELKAFLRKEKRNN